MPLRRKIVPLLIGSLALLGIVLWKTLPITTEMISEEGYLRWALKDGELTYPIYQAFLRDGDLRGSLEGESIEWIYARFPEASGGSGYDSDSFRAIIRDSSEYEVCWLNGELLARIEQDIPEGQRWGYCVLHANGKIVGFQMHKG